MLGCRRGYTRDMHTSRTQFDEEQDIEPLVAEGLNDKEVAHQEIILVVAEEELPVGMSGSPLGLSRNEMTFEGV